MPKLTFQPGAKSVTVDANTKVLVAANRNKLPIRFGCASCRCGTCAVRLAGGKMTPMQGDEKALLAKMLLPLDGSVRLACQARVESGEVEVDLTFQSTYSPDQGDDDS